MSCLNKGWAPVGVRRLLCTALLAGLLGTSAGCNALFVGSQDAASAAEQWKRAQNLWKQRDVHAFRSWRAIAPQSPEGQRARRRLARAQTHYRAGIRLFRDGDPDAARRSFVRGAALAPVDPNLYLPLARIYRARGMHESAAKYYGKYLAALPKGRGAQAARNELNALNPNFIEVFDPPATPASHAEYPTGVELPPRFALFALSLILVALSLVIWRFRRRGLTLQMVIEHNPELHAAVAYLIGSLRHELLKHRIGAVSDVLTGLGTASATDRQRAFLWTRLYGGVPIRDAWQAHRSAFQRALGHRLNLRRDRAFCQAERAVDSIARLRHRLETDEPKAIAQLRAAHQHLRRFDRHLAALGARLVRTGVDMALLEQVRDEVRGEYACSSVVLDELVTEPSPERVQVEVPRGDLVLILKNILRNAILAVGREPEDRRVGVFVATELEPTGDEAVRISVCDTSRELLVTEDLQGRDLGSGLGLVSAAVRRYGGSIEVEAGLRGYGKGLTVGFFRAFEER